MLPPAIDLLILGPVPKHGLKYDDPLPKDVVRDLLGVVRSMYRAALDDGGHPIRLQVLVEIGRDLTSALAMARHAPGSLGHRAAWVKAERACERLCGLMDPFVPMGPAVKATASKVTGKKK